MSKLLPSSLFRKRYFERGGPSDKELKADIEAGKLRGTIVCGKIYVADDALFNSAPWVAEQPSQNPLLAGG